MHLITNVCLLDQLHLMVSSHNIHLQLIDFISLRKVILSLQRQTFSIKITIHALMIIIKCLWYVTQSLWNCIPSCKVMKIVTPGIHACETEDGAANWCVHIITCP